MPLTPAPAILQEDNSAATDGGGGAFVDGMILDLNFVHFLRNEAIGTAARAGGIYIGNTSRVSLRNASVVRQRDLGPAICKELGEVCGGWESTSADASPLSICFYTSSESQQCVVGRDGDSARAAGARLSCSRPSLCSGVGTLCCAYTGLQASDALLAHSDRAKLPIRRRRRHFRLHDIEPADWYAA